MAAPTNLTTGQAGGTNTEAVKILYQKDFLKTFKDSLRYKQIAQKEKIRLPMGEGGTVEMTRFLRLPPITSALSEGDPGNAQNFKTQILQVSPKEYGAFEELPSWYTFTNIDPRLRELTKMNADQAARSQDLLFAKEWGIYGGIPMRVDGDDQYEKHNVTLDSVTSTTVITSSTDLTESAGFWDNARVCFTNDRYKCYGEARYVSSAAASGVLTLDTALHNTPTAAEDTYSICVPTGLGSANVATVAALKRAVRKAREMLIPPFENDWLVAVYDPFTEYDLTEDERWEKLQRGHASAPKDIFRGEFGEAWGIKCVRTSLPFRTNVATPVTYAADGALHFIGIFGKTCMGHLDPEGQGEHVIIAPAERAEPRLHMSSTIGWKAMLAAKALNSAASISMMCGASE